MEHEFNEDDEECEKHEKYDGNKQQAAKQHRACQISQGRQKKRARQRQWMHNGENGHFEEKES